MKNLTRVALALALLAPLAPASAQGPRWRAFTGCWSVTLDQVEPLPGRRLVCIVPMASPDAVEFVAIADSAVISRDTIDASGRAIAVTAIGCSGQRSATWSTDQRRVYLKSVVDCDGLRTSTSAILAMTDKGEWLDVRRIAAGEGKDLRVARYRAAPVTGAVPSDIAARLRAAPPREETARIASASPSGTSAVIDASRMVHPDVVEAWVYESGEQFATNKDALQDLARAGVTPNVTDAVLASSEHSSGSHPWQGDYIRSPYARGTEEFWDQGTGMRLVGSDRPMYDPWGFGYGPFGDRVYNSAVDGTVVGLTATSSNRYGRGLGYGPNGIGWGFGYGYYRKAPTGKSLLAYYAPTVPVMHQDPSGTEARTSLASPAYPGETQKAGSASKDNTAKGSSGGGVMESVGKTIVEAATGKKTATKPSPR
ncbi:MAG: hypothetical protein ABIY52_17960 [Gemmatimonadaceae bacterium]